MTRLVRYTQFACLSAAIALTACAPVGRGVQRVGSAIHEESVAFDRRVRDWFDSENIAGESEQRPQPVTAYCYKTLGDISCYNHPIPGQERRLVGKQLPEPMFSSLNVPLPDDKPEPPPLLPEEPSPYVTENVEKPVGVEVQDIPPVAPNTQQGATIVPSQPAAPRELMPQIAVD